MRKPKACPFCKAKGSKIGLRSEGFGYYVHCYCCGADGPYITFTPGTQTRAITAWNKALREKVKK